jgi:hypothetical protein
MSRRTTGNFKVTYLSKTTAFRLTLHLKVTYRDLDDLLRALRSCGLNEGAAASVLLELTREVCDAAARTARPAGTEPGVGQGKGRRRKEVE